MDLLDAFSIKKDDIVSLVAPISGVLEATMLLLELLIFLWQFTFVRHGCIFY